MQLRSVYTELTRRLINKEEIYHVRTLHPDGRLVDCYVPQKEAYYCYIIEDNILNINHPRITPFNSLPTLFFHQFVPKERPDSFEDLTLNDRMQVVEFWNSSGHVVINRKLLNKFKPDITDGLTYTINPKHRMFYIYDSYSKQQVGSIIGIKISEEASHER